MVRSKINLKLIEDTTARRVTYKKRVHGLIKKTEELSVLCGVDVCTVVYGPYNPAPVVWPSSESEARRVLYTYKGKPDLGLGQRKLDQETYLKQSLTKADEKMTRSIRRNRELDMENLRSDLIAGWSVEQVPFNDVGDLLWVIGDRLRSVEHRMRNLEGQGPANAAAVPVGPTQQADPSNHFLTQAGPSSQIGLSHQAGPTYPSQYQH